MTDEDPSTRTAAGRPLIVAHRAANRLDLLAEALEAGADMIEADVWYHRGRLEVRHSKTLGPVPIRWDRWSLERGWRLPLLLEDVVPFVAGRTRFMLDLKGGHSELSGGVMRLMHALADGAPYVVSSQWWEALAPFQEVEEATVLYSAGSARMLRALEAREGWGMREGVAAHRRLLSEAAVARFHEKMEVVASWPINRAEQLAEVGRWGVDWAISDTLWRQSRAVAPAEARTGRR